MPRVTTGPVDVKTITGPGGFPVAGGRIRQQALDSRLGSALVPVDSRPQPVGDGCRNETVESRERPERVLSPCEERGCGAVRKRGGRAVEREWRGGHSRGRRVSPKWVRVRSCASSWSCTWCTGGGPTLARRGASRAHREDISPMVQCCERGWRRAVRPCGNVNALTTLSTTLGRGRPTGGPHFFGERRTDRYFSGEWAVHDLSRSCDDGRHRDIAHVVAEHDPEAARRPGRSPVDGGRATSFAPGPTLPVAHSPWFALGPHVPPTACHPYCREIP